MADRYWVGGTATWNSTAGTKWATTSGGAGGASVPTSSDNVFFDANSGSGTVNPQSAVCANLTTTGSTNTFSGAGLSVYGNLVLGSGTIIGAITLTFAGTSSFGITTNGVTLGATVFFNGSGGTWTLNDNFTTTATSQLTNGTLDLNGKNFTVSQFGIVSAGTRTLTFGSGTLTCTGTSTNTVFNIQTAAGTTINQGTGTVVISGTGANQKSVYFAGFTIYNLTVTGNNVRITPSSGVQTVSNTLALNNAGETTGTILSSSSTLQIGNLTTNGSAGNLVLVRSSSAGSRRTIISTAASTVTVDYIDLQDCGISGTNVPFYAGVNSVNSGNNSGWVFLPTDRYWIGGGGSWTDTAHWSTTSGGSGGAAVPGEYDDVFFDSNSFGSAGQVVSFSTSPATFNTIDFTGVTNAPDLKLTGSGYFVFTAQDSVTLTSNPTFSQGVGVYMLGGGTLTPAGQALMELRLAVATTVSGTLYFEGNPGDDDYAYFDNDGTGNSVSNVEFIGAGILNLYGSQVLTVGTLTMPAGGHLEIDDGVTMKINNLDMDGTLGNLSSIDTYFGEGGSHTLLTDNDLTISYATVSHSDGASAQTYSAYESVDGGGNTNWDFYAVDTLTQTAVANIEQELTSTKDAIARIAVDDTLTQPAVAGIESEVTLTQTATASLFNGTNSPSSFGFGFNQTPINGLPYQHLDGYGNQPATARISHTYTKTQPTVALIEQDITKLQTSVGRVQQYIETTQPQNARIVYVLDTLQTATAFTVVTIETTIDATAAVQNDIALTQTASAYIGSPYAAGVGGGEDRKYDLGEIPSGELTSAMNATDDIYGFGTKNEGDYSTSSIDESDIYGVE